MTDVPPFTIAVQNDTNAAIDALIGLRAELRNKHLELEARKKALAGKREALMAENGGTNLKGTDRIKLNVGGERVTTTRETLTFFSATRLAALFSGRWENKLQRDRKGRIFLDVNPTVFKKLVDFHQFAKIASPDDPPPRPTAPDDLAAVLAAQLDFFGLTDVVAPAAVPIAVVDTMTLSAAADAAAVEVGDGATVELPDSEEGVRKRADNLAAAVVTSLTAECRALNAALDEQARDEEAHAREHDFISFFMGETKDVVDLDVTGERISVKRATLRMCADSPLARKFDDEVWAQVRSASPGDDSDDDCVQIDFSAYCFGKVVDHLRLLALVDLDRTPEGDASSSSSSKAKVPAPVVRPDQRENFARLIKYYFPGDEAVFLRTHSNPSVWPLKALGVTTSQLSDGVTAVSASSSGHCCALGTVMLETNTVWKVKIISLAQNANSWGFVGIIGNGANPTATDSYTDATAYGWAGSNQVYVGGKNTPQGGWTTWARGDEAIFLLEASVLHMWHKRTGTAKLHSLDLPAREAGWLLHLGCHGGNVKSMHVMSATDEEALAVLASAEKR